LIQSNLLVVGTTKILSVRYIEMMPSMFRVFEVFAKIVIPYFLVGEQMSQSLTSGGQLSDSLLIESLVSPETLVVME
jgi:hypothetical protein